MTNLSEEKQQFLTLYSSENWEKGLYDNIRVLDESEGHGISFSETIIFTPELIIEWKLTNLQYPIADIAVSNNGLLFILDKNANIWAMKPEDKQPRSFTQLKNIIPGFSSQEAKLSIAVYSDNIYVYEYQTGTIISVSYKYNQIIGNANVQNLKCDDPKFKAHQNPLSIAVDSQDNLYGFILYSKGDDILHKLVAQIDVLNEYMKETFPYDVTEQNQQLSKMSADSQYHVALYITEKNVYIIEVNEEHKIYSCTIYSKPNDNTPGYTKHITLSEKPSGFCVDSYETIYIGTDKGFINKFSSNLNLIGRIPGYTGFCSKLSIDKGNNIFIFSDQTQSITCLKAEKRTLIPDEFSLPLGQYFSCSLDSGSDDMIWHRIVVDAFIPDEAHINISYVVSNDINYRKINTLIAQKSSENINEIINTLNEIAWIKLPPNAINAFIYDRTGTIPDAQGRYIWLKIELIAANSISPVLKSIKLYYPLTSYLKYLPAIYARNTKSTSFIVRFLSLFETFFSEMENKIDHIERYFDIDVVEEGFYKWLSSWVALPEDIQWPDNLLKELIKKAPEFYKAGGTPKGIKEMIKLYLGSEPFIIEYFQASELPEQKETLQRLMNYDPYTFTVLIQPSSNGKEQDPFGETRIKDIFEVKRIIDMTKPAYTYYELIDLQPRIHLNIYSYMEINSYIDKASFVLNTGSNMPEDTTFPQGGHMGDDNGSKLGIDSFMILE